MAFTKTTVTANFQDGAGNPASGEVAYTLSERISNAGVTLVETEITATFDASGNASASLYSNADAGTTPTNSLYRVDIKLTNADEQTYYITVPVGPGSVDLSTLLPGIQQVE